MNRTTILVGALLIAVAIGGYWQFVEVPSRQAAAERAATELRAAEEAAAAAARAAEEAAAAAARAAEEEAARIAAEAEAAAAAAAAEAAAVANAVETEGRAALAAALDPANRDPDRLIAAIEASDLPEDRKAFFTNLVRGAEGNAALLESAVAQIRTALGL
ncbi:MAG: hypothetical protein ACK4TB_11240 [Gemmobacter sp.]